ncbi:MAG: N-acetylglucosamine-6-phosphate deacetylase [Candidatus Sumerlaeota bacterium]|nr:N-acetylglucosamine-6-phosphate deacetylase [Candidatus Sumerlaeota bacterium]
MLTCIQRGDVVTPSSVLPGGTVILEGKRIAHAGPARKTPRGAEEVSARGSWVCPGLIDVHMHGARRWSLDPPDDESFRAIADIFLAHGVTQHVPTMMASDELIAGLSSLVDATGLRRRIPGIHIEGPFVNPEKRGGIQPQYVKPPDPAEIARLQRLAGGRIRMMVFAPELPRAAEVFRAMRRHGILPCVGHTLAASAEVAAVVGRTTVNMTHLFNAMSGVDHKQPGAALYGLTHDNVYVELNADGTHVHPEALRLAYRAKRRDRIVLMSDAVIGAGAPPGEFPYMGRDVIANERGVYYKDDGTLIGSRALLNQCVGRFIRFAGARVEEAVRMASLNPATMLGLARRKGSLETGKDADVVVFSRDFEKARAVWFEGLKFI